MSNLHTDEAVFRPFAAQTPMVAPASPHLTARPTKAVQEPHAIRAPDRVSVSPQARKLRALAESRPSRTNKSPAPHAHVSIERLARIKQAYEARRIRPNPQIIATHLLEERRWL